MSDNTKSVSIVVPVYNGAQTIGRCIESLLNLNQPDDGYEIIVVENGSTDNTTEVVKKYPVRLMHSQQRGPAAARNLGITNSKGHIIAFTDADCIAHPDWLLELIKPYEDPLIVGAGGAIHAYQHSERNMVERFSEDRAPLINFVSGEHEFLPHLYTANASYRLDALKRVGGFNTDLVTGEDVDLAWRMQLQTGLKVCYAPEAIIYHHHRTTTAGLARQYRNYGFGEIVLDTMYGQYPNYPRNRLFQLRRIIQQIAALPRYVVSILVRQYRLKVGQIDTYQAKLPIFSLLIESSNILGKLEALIATRLMTDNRYLLQQDIEQYINRYY
jgi:glycosyltransferase involved in cell wall biosynthesis